MILTRCPHCDTVFRITGEQLKARAGKVRCGSCSTVFDALAALIDAPVGELVSIPGTPVPSAPTNTTPDLPGIAEAASAPADASTSEPPPAAQPAAPKAESPEEITVVALEEFTPEPREPQPGPAPGRPRPRAPTVEGEDEPLDDAPPGSPLAAVLASAAPSRGRRLVWAAGSGLLGLALAFQAAFVFRDGIVLVYPSAKPALQGLCGVLGCELSLPHKVELVGIETSDLHPDAARPGMLTLVATLRNRAPFAQRHPHLELTLTDNHDKPLARRVFAPEEYLPQGAGDAFPPNADLPLSLRLDARELDASGYRMYVFYP